MARYLYALLFLLLTVSCGQPSVTSQEASDPEAPIRSERIVSVSGLVTDMAFTPAGDLVFIQQDGRVFLRAAISGRLPLDAPAYLLDQIPVAEGVENGLLGLAIDPDFAANQFLYLFYNIPDADRATVGSRIERYRLANRQLVEPQIIVDYLPASQGQRFHYGGGLEVGPDGKIYLIFGDRNRLSEARDPQTEPGSILRYNLDGTIPDDNPFDESPVYAYGIRNGVGLAWDTAGRLYATENGADCDDELNLILPGADYGWGAFAYDTCPYPDTVGQPPLLQWTPTSAPVGLTFYTGQRMPEFKDDIMLCAFNESKLVHIVLNDEGDEITHELDIYIPGVPDPCRVAIAEGPDGWLYLANGRMIHRIGR